MLWTSMQRAILILHPMGIYIPHLYQYASALVRKSDGFNQVLGAFCNHWGHFQIPYSVAYSLAGQLHIEHAVLVGIETATHVTEMMRTGYIITQSNFSKS